MNEQTNSKQEGTGTLDQSQAEAIGGGGDYCSPDAILGVTSALTQAYENLVDFTSHVIERVIIK